MGLDGVWGAVTLKDTITVCGVLVAPEAEMLIGAEKVPAVNPDVLTLKTVEPEPVPDEVERVSQVAASVALQLNVPVPVLVIVSV